ncbi:3-methyladenine DNA glycosylase AlkD [Bacillus pakistanensis]|uniref:3-methyladenine DNA glycosylase AlkD n=1 Tax=Rossellomorea pakistanensis TaxID=992288 RepID=A0ABS2NBE1_9BACI|nr:DNA alkylation repair protein [Bacillus pakistanensis]MBM7585158.1 3-methyladenine DNA glycosylase AlkD [Bacillus pakistanensis]
MNAYTKQIVATFKEYENKELAGPMEAYMRDQFPFLGIKTPERKAIFKDFLNQYSTPELEDLQVIVKELWDQPEREFQYIALALLENQFKHLDTSYLPLVEDLIIEKSWWDTIDAIASNFVGKLLLKYPDQIEPYTRKWIMDENMWLNRTAILYQLSYKAKTDEERLFEYILLHKESDEFFIQKAIGWALREYSKTAPDSVVKFIEKEKLKPLSKREGLKYLKKKEKERVQ